MGRSCIPTCGQSPNAGVRGSFVVIMSLRNITRFRKWPLYILEMMIPGERYAFLKLVYFERYCTTDFLKIATNIVIPGGYYVLKMATILIYSRG
jgi:hypothetical protein